MIANVTNLPFVWFNVRIQAKRLFFYHIFFMFSGDSCDYESSLFGLGRSLFDDQFRRMRSVESEFHIRGDSGSFVSRGW